MSVVLGISALYHDSAAALVVDGEIRAAQQEERLSRIKNDPSLPLRAANACLALAELTIHDVDLVVYYENPYAKLERVLLGLMRSFPRSWRQFPRAIGSQLGSKLWVIDQLSEGLGIPRKKVEFISHHESHAASAFLCSPYENAAVLVVDAVGEDSSTSLWRGRGGTIQHLESIDYPHSLGLFYAAITAYLGFRVNEGEYKVMGLAAYGQPRYRDKFAKLLLPESNGAYRLDLQYFAHHIGIEKGFSRKLESLLGPPRSSYKIWDLSSAEDRHYADVAATVQAVLEDAMLALARRAYELVGGPNLCLAGGVALNCVANSRILRETAFERVFVQPAAGDAGGALGSALVGALKLGDARAEPLQSAALGVEIDVSRAAAMAHHLGLTVQELSSPADTVAKRLAENRVVAIASGRCEWGPRALGQRSILALPTDPQMQTRINRVIKGREEFRPFAPAVLQSQSTEYFEVPPSDMTPFMTTVSPVCTGKNLPAVTHVDQTARLQTVTEASAPFLYDILVSLEQHSGLPVLLNTSLNGAGEPIVGTSTDALAFFTRHPIDSMVIGDILIEKPNHTRKWSTS